MPSPRAERERATEEASEYRTRPTSDKTQDALRGPGATPGIRLSVGDVPPPVYCGTTRPEGFSVKLWDLLIKPPHLDHLFLSAVVTTHCNVRGLQQGNVPKQPLTPFRHVHSPDDNAIAGVLTCVHTSHPGIDTTRGSLAAPPSAPATRTARNSGERRDLQS